jgi:hypothetical protein
MGDDILVLVKPIIWMSEPLAGVLRQRLRLATRSVGSIDGLLETPRSNQTVVFVDEAAIAQIDRAARARGVPPGTLVAPSPIIAVCDGPHQTAVSWLAIHGWLSHVVSAGMLEEPMSTPLLTSVVATFSGDGSARLLDWVRATLKGRQVSLTQASRRIERLEKLGDFFEKHGVAARTIQQLRDVAEELLTNAFYDAPLEAGAVRQPIARTFDVSLPEECPCDLVYGCSDDFAIVRVRDPFGALSRRRVVEVLQRCARQDMKVEPDETRGGAGLGLWRIFSVASFVAVSVVVRHHTDFLVGIGKRSTPRSRPYEFHLFVREGTHTRTWRSRDDGSGDHSLITEVTEAR